MRDKKEAIRETKSRQKGKQLAGPESGQKARQKKKAKNARNKKGLKESPTGKKEVENKEENVPCRF